jgi:hypothetical protein
MIAGAKFAINGPRFKGNVLISTVNTADKWFFLLFKIRDEARFSFLSLSNLSFRHTNTIHWL